MKFTILQYIFHLFIGTTYRYMKVAILGSRDQLCVTPAVMEASSSREKLHMCQVTIIFGKDLSD